MTDEEREIKVVILSRGARCSIGVQSPGCDPVFAVIDGDLDAALEGVPAIVQEARAQWAEAPRYPTGELPKPATPAPRQSTPTQSPPAGQTRRSPQQPLF
jgi:hypothetical protein